MEQPVALPRLLGPPTIPMPEALARFCGRTMTAPSVAAIKSGKTWKHLPGPTAIKTPDNSALLDLLLEARPGLCGICDEPLTGKHRKWCGSEDCERVYHQLWRGE